MEKELRELVQRALVESFWHDFSSLVHSYREAAVGLDMQTFMSSMQEKANVYNRREGEQNVFINLYGAWPSQIFTSKNSCGYDNFEQAFNDTRARELYLNGRVVFRRNEHTNAWTYCGE